MGVLDGVVIVKGEGTVLGVKLGRPIVNNGAFATRLFSNYFEDLFEGDRYESIRIATAQHYTANHLHARLWPPSQTG